jgi:hypothetical protein
VEFQNNQMGAVLKASTKFGEKRVVLVTNGLSTLSKYASIYIVAARGGNNNAVR